MSKAYTIPATVFGKYMDRLASISQTAADKMLQYCQKQAATTHAGYQVTEAMIDYAYQLSTKYGEAAGALTADMYDYCMGYWSDAEAWRGKKATQPAEVADTVTRTEVAQRLFTVSSWLEIPGEISKCVKLCSADTMAKNAIRDGAQWAWIPGGGETCAFCITLASRGWQKAGTKMLRNGHVEHIHANCKCTFCVRPNSNVDVEGYDPEKYAEMYYNASPVKNAKQKENALRRNMYAENKDRINAQRRETYSMTHPIRGVKDDGMTLTMPGGKKIPYGSRPGFEGITRDEALEQARKYLEGGTK